LQIYEKRPNGSLNFQKFDSLKYILASRTSKKRHINILKIFLIDIMNISNACSRLKFERLIKQPTNKNEILHNKNN
jgi:hypothetical protein